MRSQRCSRGPIPHVLPVAHSYGVSLPVPDGMIINTSQAMHVLMPLLQVAHRFERDQNVQSPAGADKLPPLPSPSRSRALLHLDPHHHHLPQAIAPTQNVILQTPLGDNAPNPSASRLLSPFQSPKYAHEQHQPNTHPPPPAIQLRKISTTTPRPPQLASTSSSFGNTITACTKWDFAAQRGISDSPPGIWDLSSTVCAIYVLF